MIQSIRVENKNLNDRLESLKAEYSALFVEGNYSLEMPEIPKRKDKVYIDSSRKVSKTPVITNNKSVNLGPSQYERKNDKNFVSKKEKFLEWTSSNSKKGLKWKDDDCRSPITGINFWFDKHLIGIQFVHTVGESIQHMHLINKKVTPIQYRLSGNDYVENVILVLMEGEIVGVELVSKSGRKDNFGMKVGTNGTKKFDFGIRSP